MDAVSTESPSQNRKFRQEFDSRSWSFVGPRLVAKESRDVEDEGAKMAFHETFIMTQLEAQRFAQKFNRAVKERLCILGSERSGAARVWEVTFLDCYVYTYDHEYFGLLAEDLLEPSNRYTKWNGNNGYVYGRDLLAVSGSAPGVHSEQVNRCTAACCVHALCSNDFSSRSLATCVNWLPYVSQSDRFRYSHQQTPTSRSSLVLVYLKVSCFKGGLVWLPDWGQGFGQRHPRRRML